MKRHRIVALFPALAMVFSLCATAAPAGEKNVSINSSEEDIKNYVCGQVIESYAEYYTIPSISAVILSTEEGAKTSSVTVLVTFTKVLKAQSAYDLPYIQGLQAGIAALTDPEEIAAANADLEHWVNELEGLYIGKEQTETAEFQVEVPCAISMSQNIGTDDIGMKFVTEYAGTVSMNEFKPESGEILYANGVAAVRAKGQTAEVMSMQGISTAPSDPTDYDRITARDYARKWTCDKSGCNPEYYNPDYEYYENNDCANYVSQCIYAGGIKTEAGVWAPGTSAWNCVNVSGKTMGICEYMIDRGYFFDAGNNKQKAFAGSIICWVPSQGHVGLVDQNDTVTMTYCGHTNDRLSYSFKNSSTATFHVPVWDSYEGRYTPQG